MAFAAKKASRFGQSASSQSLQVHLYDIESALHGDSSGHLNVLYATSTVSSATNESSRADSTRAHPETPPISDIGGRVLPIPEIEINEAKLNRVQVSSLRSLRFSPDSQMLTVHSHAAGSDCERIFGWMTDTGQCLGEIRLINEVRKAKSSYMILADVSQGSADLLQPFLTCFTPMMPNQSILHITCGNVAEELSFGGEVSGWREQLKGLNIRDVLPVRHLDDHFIFIGKTKNSNGQIKALYVDIKSLRGVDHEVDLRHELDTECEDWVIGRDAACTLNIDGKNDGRKFMMASAKGAGVVKLIIRPTK